MSVRTIREKYRKLAADGRLHGTIGRAVRLRRQRDRLAQDPEPVERLCAVQPTQDALIYAIRTVREAHPRLRSWDSGVVASTNLRQKDARLLETNHGRYPGGKWGDRISYSPTVRSCVYVAGTRMVYFRTSTATTLRAPRGWVFGRDELGAYVVRRRETRSHYRYHFTGSDLESVTKLRSAALCHENHQNREMRNSGRLDAECRRAAREGVVVCLQDSLCSGNCLAGTLVWARRHGLQKRSSISARALLRLGGDNLQVKRSVVAALKRMKSDMARGYCEVLDV